MNLTSVLIKGLLKGVSLLPLSAAQALGGTVGRCGWYSNSRGAKVTRINLGLCFPEMDEAEQNQLAKRSVIETGKTMAEMGKAWMVSGEESLSLIKEVENGDIVDQAYASGQGVVFIGPHLGNWEMLGIYLSSRYKITVLYQPPKFEGVEEIIKSARGRMGGTTVPTNRKGVMAQFQALKRGEMVGILPDQEPDPESGVFAPFFGVSALTIHLASKMIQKTGAIAVCGFAKRLPDGEGFKLVFQLADETIRSNDLAESVAGLNLSVEQCVRQAPEQYQWEYKRFKRSPEGRSGFYQGT